MIEQPPDDRAAPGLPFAPEATDDEVKRERARARALRQTAWWRRKIARGVCHYCERRFKPGELTMDHLIPLIRGGKSIRANIVAACAECNRKKKHQLLLEWRTRGAAEPE